MQPHTIKLETLEDQLTSARKLCAMCDVVVWTHYGHQPLIPDLWLPWEKHSGFTRAMKQFSGEFIEKTVDRIEYGHIEHRNTQFTHYAFHIKGAVKEALLESGCLLSFPGLWDPCYYRKGELIASAIGHEGMITMWK